MTDFGIGATGIGVLFILLALRIPVAFSMFAVGFAGVFILNGTGAAFSLSGSFAR